MTHETEEKRAYFPELPIKHRIHLLKIMDKHVNFSKYPDLFSVFQLLLRNGKELDPPSCCLEYLVGPVYELSRNEDRSPGSNGHAVAEKLLVKCLTELNFVPAFGYNWTQPILGGDGHVLGQNIGGILEGESDDYLALIAHYDTISGSPGADDNAAAIGIILEVIKQLRGWNGNCNILVLFSDLEEPPNFYTNMMGSTYFFNHSPIPVDQIRCAIAMDLVGHDLMIEKREDSLFVIGAESSGELLPAVNHASREVADLQIYSARNNVLSLDYSDHHVFALNKRPFLFLSCGMGPNYHSRHDTLQNISLAKMARISQFVIKLLLELDKERTKVNRVNKEAIFCAEAEGYKRFTEFEFIDDDVEILNVVGAELMKIVNSGSYYTLEEVRKLISKRLG